VRIVAFLAIAAVVLVTLVVNLGYGLVFLGIAQWLPGGDGTAHFLVMGGLSAAVNLGFGNARYRGVPVGIPLVTSLLCVATTLEELSQGFVRGRSLQLEDLVASYAGILVAAAAVTPWVRKERRRLGLQPRSESSPPG
jgi:hypothetical protein